MLQRAVVYLIALIAIHFLAIWLAFGPGLDQLLAFLAWPAERIDWWLNPSGGSFPAQDVGEMAMLAVPFWFAVFLACDLAITSRLRRKRRAG